MKISVIISCHKDSPFLKEAIEAALNQTFDDYEVILSSDGWLGAIDLAERYGIECNLAQKKNHSHALNNAVRFAQGEWIKECHYDDVLFSNCLRDLWDARGGSLVYGNVMNFIEGEKRMTLYENPDEITMSCFYPFVRSTLHSAGFMFQRDDFLAVGGRDENLNDSEEVDYYLNLLTKGYKFVKCNSIVVKYRKHEGSKTAVYGKDKRDWNAMYFTNKYKDFIK